MKYQDERPPFDPEDTLDAVLRTELRWHAPPDLTRQLIALAERSAAPIQLHGEQAGVPATPVPTSFDETIPPLPTRSQPGAWYSVLVMILTSMAVGVSFAVAWQFYGLVGAELGLSDLAARFQEAVASSMQQMGEEVPLIHQALTFVGSLYRHMAWLINWLLIALVLWVVLDGYTPGPPLQQQRTS
jgi:hypothetical protein